MFGIEAVGHMVSKLKSQVLLAVFSGLAACLLSACGGGSDAPIVTNPPVVVVPPVPPRVWSAAQFAATSFTNSVRVSAHVDACGGVSALGVVGSNWVSQRFSPGTGWQAAQILVPKTAADFQRLDVGGVPNIFYRDSQNWVRGTYDCNKNIWTLSPAFAVEYAPAIPPQTAPIPLVVTVSETYDHNLLAARLPDDFKTLVLREFRGSSWSAPEMVTAIDNGGAGPTPFASVYPDGVLRARDGDYARLQLEFGLSVMAFRPKSAGNFQSVSGRAGCSAMGQSCIFSRYFGPPTLELDGSVTVFLAPPQLDLAKPDWLQITPSGLSSLLGNVEAWAIFNGARLIRSDGVPQWYAINRTTRLGTIYEKGQPATWVNGNRFENVGGDRLFSSPDTGHMATAINPTEGTAITPAQLAISDRTDGSGWQTNFSESHGTLSARGPNPLPAGNGAMQLVKYHADAKLEMLVTTLISTQANGTLDVTPFVFWK